MSGGVTALGFLGTLLASAAIGTVAALVAVVGGASPAEIVLVAITGGVVGSVADSAVGATIQRKAVCVVCGKPSEHFVHCNEQTRQQSGLSHIDNNIVNLIATIAGAAASLTLFVILF
jgi:uncharacterized membrane protein